MISSVYPDWSREVQTGYDPGRSLLRSIRDYQRSRFLIVKKWAVLRHRFWSAVTGADIPLNCNIGGGLLLPHPVGVVVHPNATIGPNCLFFSDVVIGSLPSGNPVIEGHVDIGSGAKVLGSVRIGAHAKIGANAVVMCDVPSGATAVGIPAKIVAK